MRITKIINYRIIVFMKDQILTTNMEYMYDNKLGEFTF